MTHATCKQPRSHPLPSNSNTAGKGQHNKGSLCWLRASAVFTSDWAKLTLSWAIDVVSSPRNTFSFSKLNGSAAQASGKVTQAKMASTRRRLGDHNVFIMPIKTGDNLKSNLQERGNSHCSQLLTYTKGFDPSQSFGLTQQATSPNGQPTFLVTATAN